MFKILLFRNIIGMILCTTVMSSYGQGNHKHSALIKNIDTNTALVSKQISLDTTWIDVKGGKIATAIEFKVYCDPQNGRARKFVFEDSGDYPMSVIFYFDKGHAVYGRIAGKFGRTDTNPELIDSVSFYIVNGKIIEPKRNKKFTINSSWYYSWMIDLVNLGRVSLF
jgi:hypothetical protein